MATYKSNLVAMWCQAGGGGTTVFPAIGPVRYRDTDSVLWAYRVMGWSDDAMGVRPVAQFSKDGITWESSLHYLGGSTTPSVASGEQWVYGDDFTVIDNASVGVFRFVRYGFELSPKVGASPEFIRGQLFIETRE